MNLGESALFTRLRPKVVAVTLFLCLLVIGISVYSDYPATWDEGFHLDSGRIWFKRYYPSASTPENPDFRAIDNLRYYPVAWDTAVYGIQYALGMTSSREMLVSKHLLTFLLFSASAAFFYLFCRAHFKSSILGLISCLFLVLSPRIFGNAFSDPKDLPFLSSMVFAFFTLQWWLRSRSIGRAIIHALACAVCIDIRLVGVMMVPITGVFAMTAPTDELGQVRDGRYILLEAIAFTVALSLCVVLLWPYLWASPILRFLKAFRYMANFPAAQDATMPYFGQLVAQVRPPWHYIPGLILVTTPISIIAFSLVGFLQMPSIVTAWIRRRGCETALRLIPYYWVLFPLSVVIVLGSTFYNGWRQMYFIYPGIVLIAVTGLQAVWRWCSQNHAGVFIRWAVVIFLGFDLASAASFMVRNHPYQALYFNRIVGGVPGAVGRFEVDYWLWSYCELFDIVLRTDSGSSIDVAGPGVEHVIPILSAESRTRLRVAQPPYGKGTAATEVYYLLSFNYGMPRPYWPGPLHTVRVDGAPVAAVYRIKAEDLVEPHVKHTQYPADQSRDDVGCVPAHGVIAGPLWSCGG